jgi:hypothetical protein
MRKEGLAEVLTNDRHFEQEGFRPFSGSSNPPPDSSATAGTGGNQRRDKGSFRR